MNLHLQDCLSKTQNIKLQIVGKNLRYSLPPNTTTSRGNNNNEGALSDSKQNDL